MVSKNDLKQLGQLGQKKFRNQLGLFAVEGRKAIVSFLENGFKLAYCFGLEATKNDVLPIEIITPTDMKKLSNLSTPPNLWAAFSIPPSVPFDLESLNLALDGIRDPGNLGTIVRVCDWFSIRHIVCSTDTVDCYNPKVVQASMGSLARVRIHYENLPHFFSTHKLTALGTDMDGENLYQTELPQKTVLVMGNEGQGISDTLKPYLHKTISIPSFGNPSAESLNVAIATGIVISEFRRRG